MQNWRAPHFNLLEKFSDSRAFEMPGKVDWLTVFEFQRYRKILSFSVIISCFRHQKHVQIVCNFFWKVTREKLSLVHQAGICISSGVSLKIEVVGNRRHPSSQIQCA
jgi:hypothetical protein